MGGGMGGGVRTIERTIRRITAHIVQEGGRPPRPWVLALEEVHVTRGRQPGGVIGDISTGTSTLIIISTSNHLVI